MNNQVLFLIVLFSTCCSLLADTTESSGELGRASSPREILKAVDIDDEVFDTLRQTSLDDPATGDLITLDRIALALHRFDLIDIERWSQPFSSAARVVGDLYRISGRASSIQRWKTENGNTIYRTDLTLDEGRPAIVWSRHIPERWKTGIGKKIVISTACYALLLQDDADRTVFVTNRLEWYPKSTDEGIPVPPHLIHAAALGIDVARFDDLEQGRKLTAKDRECFYQVLSRANKISQDHSGSVPAIDIAGLLKLPEESTGRIYDVVGTARRAIRIDVRDADIRQRFGIDHYFEVDVMVPLERPITLVDDQIDLKTTYRDFPVTVCVRELPQGFPQGPIINQPMRIRAMYLKLWAYRSERLDSSSPKKEFADVPRYQKSPLLIGFRPVPRVLSRPDSSRIDLIFAVFFIGGMLLITVFVIWQRRNSVSRRKNDDAAIKIEIPE